VSRVVVDPRLRGRVSPATLERFRARGLTVHRIGLAAYVHGQGQRWIFEVRDRGEPPAPFANELDAHHRFFTVCNRVADMAVPLVTGSTQRVCRRCQQRVWISPATRGLTDTLAIPILCTVCALQVAGLEVGRA
jgi:hypothetical protein